MECISLNLNLDRFNAKVSSSSQFSFSKVLIYRKNFVVCHLFLYTNFCQLLVQHCNFEDAGMYCWFTVMSFFNLNSFFVTICNKKAITRFMRHPCCHPFITYTLQLFIFTNYLITNPNTGYERHPGIFIFRYLFHPCSHK